MKKILASLLLLALCAPALAAARARCGVSASTSMRSVCGYSAYPPSGVDLYEPVAGSNMPIAPPIAAVT